MVIICAYNLFSLHHCDSVVGDAGRTYDLVEEREVAQVRFRHALKRAKAIYPNQLSSFSDNSWGQVVEMTIRLEAAGHSIPAAALAARKYLPDVDLVAELRRGRTRVMAKAPCETT